MICIYVMLFLRLWRSSIFEPILKSEKDLTEGRLESGPTNNIIKIKAMAYHVAKYASKFTARTIKWNRGEVECTVFLDQKEIFSPIFR